MRTASRNFKAGFTLAALLIPAGWLCAQRGDGGSMLEESPGERAEQLVELVKRAAGSGSSSSRSSLLAGIELEKASPELKRIIRTLRETSLNVSLEKQSLPDVVKLFRDVSGLNFAISHKARKAIEESNPRINLSLKGVTLENVLNLLALQLGEYRFTIRYNIVLLIRKEEYRPKKIFRIYNVTDLLRRRTDFPAPPMALTSRGLEFGNP